MSSGVQSAAASAPEPALQRRRQAYAAIDSERDYQDRVWGGTSEGGKPGNGFRTVDAYTAYLQRYQNLLIEIVGTSDDDAKKLEVIRKIAGLCVVCMEQHGAPLRGSASLAGARSAEFGNIGADGVQS